MVTQLEAKDLQSMLGDQQPPMVLDVREPWELKVCTLPNITHIPMRDIHARIGELDKQKRIVVLCHHGVRSQFVANFLAQQGYAHIFNLRGGIDAWAKTIDPAMATY
jgi:rhodanese-related sulfurtransferase